MTYLVDGKSYEVIGQTEMKSGIKVPVIDMPMMSDERWNELAKEQAVHNFIRENGKEPDSVEVALQWQRECIESRLREEGDLLDILDKIRELVEELIKFSLPELLEFKDEWMRELKSVGSDESVQSNCMKIMDTVIAYKMEVSE